MLIEEQIAARQERAANAVAKILERPPGGVLGDYTIMSASGKHYRVAVRGTGLFENYCSCPDFAVNTLGTCKHIEAMLARLRQRHRKALETSAYKRTRASISLHYGDSIEVRLRLPAAPSAALAELAKTHFDAQGLLPRERYRQFAGVLDAFRHADSDAVIYSDVLDFIDRENELSDGLDLERKLLAKLKTGKDPFPGLLKTTLLPYQTQGAIFAACRGRVVLADDMGLGKTVQALAATELLRRNKGIERVLVVAPASVKYQWKTEIEKFTTLSAQVIDGLLPKRRAQYASPTFFTLTSYELVLKDVRDMHELKPDLIILDEAQRIRNWTTATARTIKQLKSRYAFVLTGTPLENKLEELFSVVEFVDGRRLGPAFRFLHEHKMEDDEGHLLGYKGLDQIKSQMAPILLRRTRPEVLKQLPARTDQIFQVPLTPEQAEHYYEQSDILAALMRKWERQRWLSEIDQKRIMCCLQNMRMICNSTFLFDKQTHHSPKLKEFCEIMRELAIEENRKVVVFSEFERMTHLAGEELTKLGIGFVSLHGGVPSRQRGALMEKFKTDPECKVFLSTDAGGVGLNLQSASVVVNFEPPWNPARLEQRIGRVHRMGQSRPVHVIHMLTSDSIEQRVWETLKLKKSLFAGVFDSTTGEVDFSKLRKKSMLQVVKEIFADQPGRPKPIVEEPAPEPVNVMVAAAGQAVEPEAMEQPELEQSELGQPAEEAVKSSAPRASARIEDAAAGLLEAGLKFLESVAPPRAAASAAETPASPLEQALSGLFKHDPATNRPMIAIPLPESINQERIATALSGLVNLLGRAFPAAGK